jgi:hypothetical protein
MFKYRITENQFDASTKRSTEFIPEFKVIIYIEGDERSSVDDIIEDVWRPIPTAGKLFTIESAMAYINKHKQENATIVKTIVHEVK